MLIAAGLLMFASAALADEIDDAHKRALEGSAGAHLSTVEAAQKDIVTAFGRHKASRK